MRTDYLHHILILVGFDPNNGARQFYYNTSGQFHAYLGKAISGRAAHARLERDVSNI